MPCATIGSAYHLASYDVQDIADISFVFLAVEHTAHGRCINNILRKILEIVVCISCNCM